MINHYVMFRLEDNRALTAEAAIKFKNAIEALVFQIPELIEASVGINENPAEKWTLVLSSKVETWEALAAYAAHPAHLAAVALIKPLIAERAAVDFVS
ncbi:MAG: Dabb family protein [Pseudoflavonifractor sp.]|nr:Dabb family protein [Alloprevotella sp.]MCM1116729.1 Dabb family protein [Pseudoflavonifractor sp.]